MDLSAYSFVLVGEWVSSATVKSGITYKMTALALDRVIYAFVVDGLPKYIGICEKDTTALEDRMGRYKAASLMLNHGVPILVVSKILGHSNPSVN